jgi:elongation factor 2
LSKSPNKFNRLYVQAEPIEENLLKSLEGMEKTDPKERTRILIEEHSWSPHEARKLWAFNTTNLLVDSTQG